MSSDWRKENETLGDGQEVWGSTTSPGLGLEEAGKSVRTSEQRGEGPRPLQTWVLTLEAGQIGIPRFGF